MVGMKSKGDLLPIMEKHLAHYQRLLLLTKKQREEVSSGRQTHNLEPILSEKEKVIHEIKEGDRFLSEFPLSEDQKNDNEIHTISELIRTTGEKIMTMERESRDYLESEKKKLRGKMSSLSKGKSISKGYGPQMIHKPGFISIRK